MLLQDQVSQYLDTSGESMRSLSMRAGLNPKAVSDILNRPGHRPMRSTVEALGTAMGVLLPGLEPRMTYAQLIARLSKKTGDAALDRRNATLVSRLKKVLQAAEWMPEIEYVDRDRVIERFSGWSPATLGLSQGSFRNYKSDALAAIDEVCGSNRKPGIRDVTGLYREVHEAIQNSDLPQDMKLISGSFLHFLDQSGLLPREITQSVLEVYFHRRCAEAPKTEAVCRKHVKRVAALCTRLSSEPAFAEFQFPAVDHPFDDGRDKYGVSTSVLRAFLQQFDGPVTRWAMGDESRDGLSYEAFLKQLDRTQPQLPMTGKLALLKPKPNGRKKTEEERRSAGFLVEDETWSQETLANRRGIMIAGAKALYTATGYLIESVEEYTIPVVVEGVLEAVQVSNSGGEFPSSYASTLGKAIKKLARDYVGRDLEEVESIASTIKDYAAGGKGITKRNKDKLRQIIGDRQQRLLDLGEILIDEVNAELDRQARKKRGASRLEYLDIEMVRDVMCVLASDILIARAPRKANVTRAKLSWISWRGELATITVPNVEVKMRTSDDPDLPIPLGENESRRLRMYLDKIRPKALRKGDELNPFLFPAQGSSVERDQPFVGLLERLMRHTHRITGIRMNPHLYRHFLGWLWLKEDPDRLPDVQRLLGHKSLETTLAFYAEIDEHLALDRWQAYLVGKKSRQPKGFKEKGTL
ncbi:site-specific integrase [Jannaschia rubra]|uniref:Site-specific tyrosine recombinase XerC n=1 Tax=Jannaschia rubra TaxID=282197 RepID=A0A0M6XT19_9RHOB|nr:tyrosine-type recombinase/integrase [Jannaschia rubra]CTQ33928.1 site-specific tyrosine recombinase XerC [Jannaschia rubra]SFG76380.1 Phage integrase family protein [Jannaschia rubra]